RIGTRDAHAAHMRFLAGLVAASLFVAPSAFAQDPPPAAQPQGEPVDALDPTPPPRAPQPLPPPEPDRKEPAPTVRDSGMRLGLDLGFTRATTARSDNLT